MLTKVKLKRTTPLSERTLTKADVRAKERVDSMSQLSQEQLDVVKDVGGVRLVAACPGGGKTKTLVQSVSYLINELKVSPRKILAFTFTNQAAEEMRDRLELELGPVKAGQLDCLTMHSFFYRIFRDQCQAYPGWNYNEVTIIDRVKGGKKKIYRDVAKKLDLAEIDIDFGQFTQKIGWWKNWNITPDEALEQAENVTEELIAQFYKAYEEVKNAGLIIDFEDMLLLPLRLFEEFPEIGEEYSRLYEHIFVDEYHDTSPVQNELIKAMSQVHGNLFLVCDPNQSIYGFRGANPDVVLEYQSHFPGSRLLKLTRNFRSRAEIVESCYRLISHNTDANALGLTASSQKPNGVVGYLGQFANESAEARAVVERIMIESQGGFYRDHTILYRMNSQSRSLEDQLVAEQVPYRIVGASSFYKRREVLDLMAYLKFVDAPEPLGEAFERIYNRPNRFLGKAWYRQYLNFSSSRTTLTALLSANYSHTYMKNGALRLNGQLNSCMREHQRFVNGDINLSDLASEILRIVGYEAWLAGDDEQQQERVDGLKEFIHALGRFSSIDAFFRYVELIQSKLENDQKDGDRVTLMTIHKAKGTEHKNVYVIGLNGGVLPHALSQVYEERRVCFVAVSRAEDECWLSSTKTFRGKPVEPSVFLSELGLAESAVNAQIEGVSNA